MKYTKILLILLLIWLKLSQICVYADNRIVVYLKNAPPEVINKTIEDANNKKLLTPKLSGLVAIYGGYMDISDKDGIIQFPLRQASKKIYIAFTEKIKLVRVKNNTFSHREFVNSKKNKTSIYLYEKKIDDKKNFYWNVKEVQVPQDKKINPLTMVIFTHPSNVFIRTGDFLSNDSQHFVLPEIYVINTYNQALTTLSILGVKRFFEPVKFEEKSVTEKSTQGLLNNT